MSCLCSPFSLTTRTDSIRYVSPSYSVASCSPGHFVLDFPGNNLILDLSPIWPFLSLTGKHAWMWREREQHVTFVEKCITVAVFLPNTHPGGLWRLQQQYSKLATFAQDLLSVPASQAYVESSVCGLLTPERRNGMNKSRENAYCARNSKMLRDSGFVFQSHFTDCILFWQSVALFVSPVNSTH